MGAVRYYQRYHCPTTDGKGAGEVFEGGKKKSGGVATHRKGEIWCGGDRKRRPVFFALALKLGKRGDRVLS